MSTRPDTSVGTTEFQNRADEIQQLLEYVESGGQPIVVMAMPTMGKSRLLKEVPRAMDRAGLSPSWDIDSTPLDLSANDNAAARSDLGDLLTLIFPSSRWDLDRGERALRMAGLIRDSGRSRLVLLDGAELLRDDVARELRDLLGEANRALANTPDRRIAFVAASRMEIPAFQGISPSPRFQQMLLQHFNERIVVDALTKQAKKLGLEYSDEDYVSLGRTVWRVTEGLPGLLEVTLEWLKDHGASLISMDEGAREEVVMDAVVRPYIHDTLLSLNVLLPRLVVRQVPEAQRGSLAGACSTLVLRTSACRLITQSHLRLLADKHTDLKAALATIERAGMIPHEVFGALSVVKPTEDLWTSLYESVRRLYFRMAWPKAEQQTAAHRDAQAIYESWKGGLSQVDRARFLLERFYHEVEIVRLLGARGGPPRDHLESYLKQLLTQVGDPIEHELFREALRVDEELHRGLEDIEPGLASIFV